MNGFRLETSWDDALDDIIEVVTARLPVEFAGITKSLHRLPCFKHEDLEWTSVLVPGGTFAMGLSLDEEAAARDIRDPPPMDLQRMKPVHQSTVSPMLVAQYPILECDYPVTQSVASCSQLYPAAVSYQDAMRIAKSHGGRLLNESEWEYCCRGGTTSLFFFGNSLPTEEELASLVDFDLNTATTCNPFGLYGLFSGEWCSSKYSPDYHVSTEPLEGTRVIRGGAAQLWPWQGDEWVWCVSANRMPSTELFDSKCCFRIAWDLL